MKTKTFFLLLLAAFLATTCITTPAVDFGQLGKANDKVPLTSNALTGVLPNGLRYFILENHRPENRAHLALVVNAGSVLETDAQLGYAHFVEHLAFADTARFPELALIEYLRTLGMRFGPDANAYTSYNETVYHFDVPVETVDGVKRIPDKALAIIDDWSFAVTFRPQDVDSERLVILEEYRARLGAMERVRQTTLPILFAGSAYANRQPIGIAETIENATSESLKGFYDRWYTSDNMALVFIGDFDAKTLEAELASHFNMPKAQRPVNRPVHELPPPKRGNFQIEVLTDPELTSSSFMIYYKQRKGAQRGTIGHYRQMVIDYLIDSMLSTRFDENADNPASASTGSWGGIWRWARDSRFYTMGTQPKTGRAEEALIELLLEKESMRRFGFTESEFNRAKINLVSYMERQVSEKDRRDSRLFVREFTSHFLFGEDLADIEWELDAILTLLPGITLEEVSGTAKSYFAPNDCIVFLIAPTAEMQSLPSTERIRAIFQETERTALMPRQEEVVNRQLLESPPVPGTITNETLDNETGAVILTLSNGAKVILKETANRNNEIVMYGVANGGTANAPLEHKVSVNLASEMVSVSGLGPYSRIELVNMLAGKQVAFSFWTSNFSRGFQGSSTTSDINTFFEMLHLFFTNPNFDERAIAAMLDQYRTNLALQEEDPQRFFSRELTKIINSNHPRFRPLELADIDTVSLEQAFAFLNRCINPGDYTFVFTGNINPIEMKALCAKYVASIANAPSMNSWTDPNMIRPAQTNRELFKGQDDRSIVYLGWFAKGPADFSEDRNQVAAVLSDYLDILLTDEIREKLGGVYSISSGAYVSTIPAGEYRLNVFFHCNPQRAEELAAAVIEHITEISTKPLNQATFDKAVEALIMGHANSMQRNLHIAQSYANSAVVFNTPLSRLNTRPDSIRAVTTEQVQDLCRQMLANGAVQVMLFPENHER